MMSDLRHGNPLRFAVLASLSLTAISGCESHGGGAGTDVTVQALDCPDGYVSYDFSQGAPSIDSELAQAVPDASVPYFVPGAIQVEDVQCWRRDFCTPDGECQDGQLPIKGYRRNVMQPPEYEWRFTRKVSGDRLGELESAIEEQCNDQASCAPSTSSLEPLPSNAQGLAGSYADSDWCEIKYTCDSDRSTLKSTGGPGKSGIGWTGEQQTDSSDHFMDVPYPRPSCMGTEDVAARARLQQRKTGLACVPRYCTGKTRRSANMDCVPDPSMEVVQLSDLTMIYPWANESSIRPYDALKYEYSAGTPVHKVYENVTAVSRITQVRAGEVPLPTRARLHYWMSDVYVPNDVTIPDDASADKLNQLMAKFEHQEVFRCSAFTADLSRASADENRFYENTPHQSYFEHETQISPSCFGEEGRKVSRGELERVTGDRNAPGKYKLLGTLFNYSYDMLGHNIVLEGDATADDVGTTCAPNPPGFFYDAKARKVDLLAYLNQRRLSIGWTKKTSKFGDDPAHVNQWVSLEKRAPVVRALPQTVELSQPAIEVTTSRFGKTSIPVNVSWALHHASKDHPLNPNARACDASGSCGAPVKLKATFWAHSASARSYWDLVKLGELPLDTSKAGPEGATATGEFVMPASVRSQFFQDGSALYIPRDKQRQAFGVVMCIDAETTPFASATQKSTNSVVGNLFNTTFDVDYNGTTYSFGTGNGEHDRVTTYKPSPHAPKLSMSSVGGCVFSKAQLVVTPLRLTYPVQPVGSVAFDGVGDVSKSGSSKMSAAQETDSESVCEDAKRQNCTEAMRGGSESKGEASSSYYSNDVSITRKVGDSASLDGTTKMLGFNVIDMADSMGDENSSPWATPGDAIKINLTPNWDNLIKALRKTTPPNSPTEWNRGSYAGRMGLGLGIGYKTPFQIGPIPGLMTFSLSAGFSVGISATIKTAPSAAETYPCIGSKACYEMSSQAATFKDAMADCTTRGGRLAELGSDDEAAAVVAAANAKQGSFWLGGQQAFSYPTVQCGESYNQAACLPGSVSSFRWLSNDQEFARATGGGAASYGTPFYGANRSSLVTQIPRTGGLVYASSTGGVSIANGDESRAYICRYEPAAGQVYVDWSFATDLAVGGGLGISLCVPGNDDWGVGICIGGNLNVVTVAMSPTLGATTYFLLDSSKIVRRAKLTYRLSAPWQVTVLDGLIWGSIDLPLFSIRWDIVTFGGFKVAGGDLFEPIEQPFDLKL